MTEDKLQSEVQKRLTASNGAWSKQYKQMEDDLKFSSGDQWDDEFRERRGKRPCLTLNFTRTYINRVVNPLRMNPFGINVESKVEVNELVKGAIRDIEYSSNAKEAVEVAYECAVTCGIGWIQLYHDYMTDDGLDQEIKFRDIPDPTSVWIDPASTAIDGSDMEYAFVMNYEDKEKAEKLYKDDDLSSESFSGIDTMFSGWNVPEDSVPDLLYYKIEHEQKPRYWYEDGQITDEKLEIYDEMGEPIEPIRTRNIDRKTLKVYHFIGTKLIEESTLNMPFIPIIPVYGDRLWDDDLRYGGIVHIVRPSQQMVNFYASSEAELAALAPKSPWLAAEGQVEGYEKIWKTANTEAHDVLVYKPETLGEKLVPPPSRVDNQAQTQGLQALRLNAQQDMGRETGIFDNMFGAGEGMGAESGRAVMAKQGQGEIATAQYLDNLKKSISHSGRCLLWMAVNINDTERPTNVRSDDGVEKVSMNLGQLIGDPKTWEITANSGPAYESRRRESINGMMALGQIMPDKMPIMADKIAKNSDFPESDVIAKRFEMMLPPEMREDTGQEVIPPEAKQALDSAQATIGEMQETIDNYAGVIQQLQTIIIDNEKDRETELQKTRIQEASDLAQAQIKAETDLTKERMKQIGDDDRLLAKIDADTAKSILQIAEKLGKLGENTTDMIEGMDLEVQAPFDAYRIPPQVPGPVNPEVDFATGAIEDISDLVEGEQPI